MDAMALEDNTEAAVSADANDAEADKVIEQFLTGDLIDREQRGDICSPIVQRWCV